MNYSGSILCILSFFLFSSLHQLYGQDEDAKPFDGYLTNFTIGYGGDLVAGDLKERFGNMLKFTTGVDYITRNNWIYNLDFYFMFGDRVREDVLASLRTTDGYILGDDGAYADIFLRQRGLFLGLGIGKLFQFNDKSRSGLKTIINAGILQHNIRFVDERNSVAQLRLDGFKGYDRLTRGFALKESVAYKNLSVNRRLNFEIGLDFIQGFTSEVRAINFDSGLPVRKNRIDLSFGVRLAWILPFYHNPEQTVYY